MMEGIQASVSALRTTSRRVDQTAHNVANVSTPGFVPGRVDQVDMATGGVRAVDVSALPPGPITASAGSLDLAIDGGGFFVLTQDDGAQLYTRAGNFTLNADGVLTDQLGRSVNPGITIPDNATQIRVNAEGQVQALAADGTVINEQQLLTATFGNVGGLQAVGGNAFRATEASGPAVLQAPGEAGHGAIVSGMLQSSGTDLAREMVNLITDQRVFEANLATLRRQDEMLGTVLDILE